MERSRVQKITDFITFPFRALTLIENDRWGLSSLRSERFDYCANEVRGFCLDVGCGKHNWFVMHYLDGNGKGVDVYPYDGLSEEQIMDDPRNFPFEDEIFETVTFIANLNHIPEPTRDIELREAYRCLKPGGNIIVTMGNPIAEVLTHNVVWLYDRFLGTQYDVDNIRGMKEGESLYLRREEVFERLSRAGFSRITRKRFGTQWGLNSMYIGWKLLSPDT